MHPYATDSNERRSVPIYIALLSIIVAFLLGMFLESTSLTIPWWFDSPAIIGFYSIIFYFFEKSLWKYKIFRWIGIVKLPNLNGTWKGTVISSYDEHLKKHETTFTIRQNWHRISIVGQFERSKSYSLTASIIVDYQPETTLSYEYRNEPISSAVETMEIHRGFISLTLNPNGQELSGTYYSGRGRQNIGELKLERVSSA